MTVDDLVQARIAEAVQRRQRRQQQRAELDQARQYGITARHAAKLARRRNRKDATS